MAAIDLKHATIAIRDGTGTPNTLTIRVGQGNLTFTEKRNIEYRLNRGLLDSAREGDQAPMELNFEFEWWYLLSDTGEPVTPKEALTQTGAASAWKTTSADSCEPYAVDLVITYVPGCGTTKNEVIVFQDFRWESMDHNLKDAQISVKGQCNITHAISTRVAPSPMPIPSQLPTGDSAVGNIGFMPNHDEIMRDTARERERTILKQYPAPLPLAQSSGTEQMKMPEQASMPEPQSAS